MDRGPVRPGPSRGVREYSSRLSIAIRWRSSSETGLTGRPQRPRMVRTSSLNYVSRLPTDSWMISLHRPDRQRTLNYEVTLTCRQLTLCALRAARGHIDERPAAQSLSAGIRFDVSAAARQRGDFQLLLLMDDHDLAGTFAARLISLTG
jgi:hypothetical protein